MCGWTSSKRNAHPTWQGRILVFMYCTFVDSPKRSCKLVDAFAPFELSSKGRRIVWRSLGLRVDSLICLRCSDTKVFTSPREHPKTSRPWETPFQPEWPKNEEIESREWFGPSKFLPSRIRRPWSRAWARTSSRRWWANSPPRCSPRTTGWQSRSTLTSRCSWSAWSRSERRRACTCTSSTTWRYPSCWPTSRRRWRIWRQSTGRSPTPAATWRCPSCQWASMLSGNKFWGRSTSTPSTPTASRWSTSWRRPNSEGYSFLWYTSRLSP